MYQDSRYFTAGGQWLLQEMYTVHVSLKTGAGARTERAAGETQYDDERTLFCSVVTSAAGFNTFHTGLSYDQP